MDERILKWLFDIKLSIEEIESFFEEDQRDFYKYKENLMLKIAVERNLEIIGEAINRIITRDSSYNEKISNARSIIGFNPVAAQVLERNCEQIVRWFNATL